MTQQIPLYIIKLSNEGYFSKNSPFSKVERKKATWYNYNDSKLNFERLQRLGYKDVEIEEVDSIFIKKESGPI